MLLNDVLIAGMLRMTSSNHKRKHNSNETFNQRLLVFLRRPTFSPTTFYAFISKQVLRENRQFNEQKQSSLTMPQIPSPGI